MTARISSLLLLAVCTALILMTAFVINTPQRTVYDFGQYRTGAVELPVNPEHAPQGFYFAHRAVR